MVLARPSPSHRCATGPSLSRDAGEGRDLAAHASYHRDMLLEELLGELPLGELSFSELPVEEFVLGEPVELVPPELLSSELTVEELLLPCRFERFGEALLPDRTGGAMTSSN